MYRFGGFSTKKEFVDAYNANFETTLNAANFGRDFSRRFMGELGKTPAQLKEAADAMRQLSEDSDAVGS